jgi:hypothetical protein
MNAVRSILVAAMLVAGCASGPKLAWYGHTPDRSRRVEVHTDGDRQWLSMGERTSARYAAVEAVTFDPGGRHVAFAALRGTRPERWSVVLDFVEGAEEPGVAGLRFGPDGARFAYAAERGRGWEMVIDGRGDGRHERIAVDSLEFSPDGRRAGYIAGDDRCERAIVEGVAAPCHLRVHRLLLSNDASGDLSLTSDDGDPEGARLFRGGHAIASVGVAEALFADDLRTRWAVSTRDPAGARVIVDGRAHDPFERIGLPRFSPGGAIVAYTAERDGHAFMVRDGRAGDPHAEIEPPVFAGRELAYLARERDRSRIVVGDRVVWESPVLATGLTISPAGDRLGWLHREAGGWVITVDGAHHRFDVVIAPTLCFSRDGRHWAALVGSAKARKLSITVDGDTLLPFDSEELFGGGAENASELPRWISAELEMHLSRARSQGS